MSPKRLSQMGESYLEEAVLGVLKTCRGEYLTLSEIRERAGIYHCKGAKDDKRGNNNAIVYGIVYKLVQANRIHKEEGKRGGRYTLADDEFQ